MHLWHACLAADENHVFDVGNFYTSVFDGDFAGPDGPLDQLFDQRFKFGAGNLDGQMLGPGLIGRDVGQIHLGLLGAG